MPQSPAANPDEKKILTDMVGLAQKTGVATGNQITAVDAQLVQFQHAQDIFQKRYAYWDGYIGAYHAERKSLNGIFILNPVSPSDYTDFTNTTRRLYQKPLTNPIRISQFNNVTASPTGTEANNEGNLIPKEVQYRGYLQSGFSSNPLPPLNTYQIQGGFNSGDTSVTIHTASFVAFSPSAPGRLIIFNTADPLAGVIVEYLTVTEVNPSPRVFTYRLDGLRYAPGFASLPNGSTVTSSGPVFTDSERASQTALIPSQQSNLYADIAAYQYWVGSWQQIISAQVTQVAAEMTAGEDAPDTAYGASLQSTATALQNYLTAVDVSDAGLAGNATLNALRTGQIPVRVSWIDARLIQQTKAYDSRYHYADRIYNLSDGAIVTLSRTQAQKTSLISQQALANSRAAQLSGEIF